MLDHTDQQPTDNVNHHDQQAGNRIAAHEFTGTVHRAVKVCFLRHFGTAFFRLIFTNDARVEIGVDSHLFTGHAVKHEARAHFSDTPGTLGDNHEVDDNEDDKHHDTHGEVAAHQEVTKRLDHFTCRRATGVPFHQDDTGGGDVQRQTQ